MLYYNTIIISKLNTRDAHHLVCELEQRTFETVIVMDSGET